MMVAENELGQYEGLVRTTAARYLPILGEDFDDICQFLRIKVWRALESYDPARATQPRRDYVFSCVRNGVKDLLKARARRLKNYHGGVLSVESLSEADSRFELGHLSEDAEQVYFDVEDEDLNLPATLDAFERRIVVLLLLDFNQTEISRVLGVTRQRVRTGQAHIERKMADWKPDAQPERNRLRLAA
jgi:RNA polymerase sigma factor (sigma-70 family)